MMKIIYDTEYFEHDDLGIFFKYPTIGGRVYVFKYSEIGNLSCEDPEEDKIFIGYIWEEPSYQQLSCKYFSYRKIPDLKGFHKGHVAGVVFSKENKPPIISVLDKSPQGPTALRYLVKKGFLIEILEGNSVGTIMRYQFSIGKNIQSLVIEPLEHQ